MDKIDLEAPGAVTIRPLTVADRDACVAVENACFTNPDHRATPEKFSYRLTACPEICLGVFVHTTNAEALAQSSSGVMVGHVIATRCTTDVLTDASMGVPKDWRQAAVDPSSVPASPLGHQTQGSTVAVHSLGVVPSVQGKGLGTKLMKAYLERMAELSKTDKQHKIDRVALICQDYLVDYYKKLGFASNGPSEAQFGGGGWFDMYYAI
ncbi:hypothetical protein SEUCBS139899_001454 [Sporothrix eucalyptigena]|uniref:N-acetyltransferase domain-containing protein n=1 Tax=Sporothrix eucalyptigena TaxID=1812306 RepID=A0ABP0CFJ3_9PEZI